MYIMCGRWTLSRMTVDASGQWTDLQEHGYGELVKTCVDPTDITLENCRLSNLCLVNGKTTNSTTISAVQRHRSRSSSLWDVEHLLFSGGNMFLCVCLFWFQKCSDTGMDDKITYCVKACNVDVWITSNWVYFTLIIIPSQVTNLSFRPGKCSCSTF